MFKTRLTHFETLVFQSALCCITKYAMFFEVVLDSVSKRVNVFKMVLNYVLKCVIRFEVVLNCVSTLYSGVFQNVLWGRSAGHATFPNCLL